MKKPAYLPSVSSGQLIQLCFGLLPRMVGVLMTLVLLLAGPVRAQQGEESGGTGEMQWYNADSASYEAAVTQASHLDIQISGMIAVVTLEQTFDNTTGHWQEGVYTFPLPSDAAVRHMEMQVGDRLVVGEIREREEAKQMYVEAMAEGKKASLVEQQRPNMFTNRIANIGPGEQVKVRLEYVQQASYISGEFSLRIPTTITPRYIPGKSLLRSSEAKDTEAENTEVPQLAATSTASDIVGWALPTDQVPDANAISPWLYPQVGSDVQPLNPLTLDVVLNPGMPLARVEALYHDVTLSREGEGYRMSLANGVAEMDRDLELRWQPVSGSAPRAAVFTEQVDGEYYGLLMVVPPVLATEQEVLAREMVFVIDTSGSMGGVSIEQAKQSLAQALQQLRPGDYFNVIAFESTATALFRQSVPVNSGNLARAAGFVEGLQASGGTEMMAALELALNDSVTAETASRVRQVVFITDGSVGNEEALFAAIEDKLGNSRLFTVGIGSAPNHWFMDRAAQVGRGFSIQISRIDEVQSEMSALFERISAPLAADMKVAWQASQVEAWPARVPDLYKGEPLVQAVHFGKTLPGAVEVMGNLAGQSWSQKVGISPSAADHSGVASIWARRKIASLLALRNHSPEDEIRPAVLEVALTHQLASPYTSFIAIEERISREPVTPLETSPVPNTRPQGQSHQSYAYPNTATTARANAYFGCFALFVALLVYVMRRPEVDHVPHTA